MFKITATHLTDASRGHARPEEFTDRVPALALATRLNSKPHTPFYFAVVEVCDRHPSSVVAWDGAVGCDQCCRAAQAAATARGAGPNEGCYL